MKGRYVLALILGLACLLLASAAVVDHVTARFVRRAFLAALADQLIGKARVAAALPDLWRLDPASARKLAEASGARLTVLRAGQASAVPEAARALAGGTAWSERAGSLEAAVPAPGGAVLLELPLDRMESDLARVRGAVRAAILLALLPVFAAGAILVPWVSRRFHERMRQTVEQFEREHAELERLERVRKDFVINVSHELRTPLASIQGYTETLLDGALNDPAHNVRFLGIIRHNAERLTRITEDLLALSRIEQKRQKFAFAPHSVNCLLEDALDLMRPIAERSKVSLHLDPSSEPLEAWCDSEAVSQILSNLLDNAIKYTPAGGSISVGARPRDRDKSVEIWVRDTGIGIPPEDLPRLFERFYRVDKARSRQLGGTGLGLSIVKHLVSAHGGTTRVESRVNEGSTFFFTLPAGEPAAKPGLNAEFTPS